MDIRHPPMMKVTLLLQGGFHVGVEVARTGRELRDLLGALAPSVGPRAPRLLHLRSGRETLTVPSDKIVAFRTTDGTLALAQRESSAVLPLPATSAPAMRFVGGEPVPFARSRSHYPSPALVADGFLTRDENAALLRHALTRQSDFKRSGTTTGVEGYRISRVLFALPQFQALIRSRVARMLPEVVRRFRGREFKPGRIEVQLTAHNDGHFYKIHSDNGSPTTAGRVLTYVYYFCHEPRRFRGGELRIYESVARNGQWRPGRTCYEIAPHNNRIVFFPARYLHEVLPVVCPSRRFEDGRFTINGWIHRAAEPKRS